LAAKPLALCAFYDRTYRVLFDARIIEELAEELATQRTLAVALKLRDAMQRRIILHVVLHHLDKRRP
jgi:hypothetical protein